MYCISRFLRGGGLNTKILSKYRGWFTRRGRLTRATTVHACTHVVYTTRLSTNIRLIIKLSAGEGPRTFMCATD